MTRQRRTTGGHLALLANSGDLNINMSAGLESQNRGLSQPQNALQGSKLQSLDPFSRLYVWKTCRKGRKGVPRCARHTRHRFRLHAALKGQLVQTPIVTDVWTPALGPLTLAQSQLTYDHVCSSPRT